MTNEVTGISVGKISKNKNDIHAYGEVLSLTKEQHLTEWHAAFLRTFQSSEIFIELSFGDSQGRKALLFSNNDRISFTLYSDFNRQRT